MTKTWATRLYRHLEDMLNEGYSEHHCYNSMRDRCNNAGVSIDDFVKHMGYSNKEQLVASLLI